ncbi:MFS transporter [Leuconostoc gelidum subsp. aenigmaticum]|uniref:MFS transporter n=1 Tax=Leuconostoc gelidum TaxID=1244 RepID=UPI001CC33E4F|nr:MFS transporter [Leuconostoc gelidum]MBZ6003996.1 MFS transporter [Leuconostoc gelidum subsp. aenigmaticum]
MFSSKKKIFGLITLSLIMFMVTLDTTITNIALPNMTDFFKSNLTDTNWISTIYVLVMSVVIIPASKFGDQFGRKKTMAVGLIIFGVGSMLCGFSNSLPILIIMRLIQGVGGAIVTPIMIPLSVELFGRKQANQAVGIIGAVTAVAAAAGPPIGGLLLKFLSWQWIFFVNTPIVIITFILLLSCFEESVDPTISKKIDFGGLLFLTLGLSLLTFLLVKGYDIGWQSRNSFILMGGSLVSLIIFFLIERKVKSPLIELHLFKEITFFASTMIYFMCGFAIVCSSLIFNFYLEDIRDYSALNTSYIIMFMSITVMISMPIGSQLAEKIGYRIVITTGMGLMAVSMFLLATLSSTTTKQFMVGYMIVLGIGFGFACLSIVAAVQYIPENKAGIASGVVNAARQLGTCLGIALLVGTMTHNVDVEKTIIRHDSIKQVTGKKLPENIATLINDRVTKGIESKEIKSKPDFQNSLKRDVAKLVTQTTTRESPQDNNLRKIHNGLSDLQKQFEDKPETVSRASDQIVSVQKEIETANTDVLYTLVKSNPSAATVLMGYQQQLGILNEMSDSANKETSMRQLSGLIVIYQAGTDSTVHNATDFRKKLTDLMAKEESNPQQQLLQAQEELATTLSQKGKINTSITSINQGVSRLDIGQRLKDLFVQLKYLKNNQLTRAFTQTFLLAAWIITAFTFVGIFTGRKRS